MNRGYAFTLLVVDILVLMLAIGLVQNPVVRILISVGAGLSGIVAAAILYRFSVDSERRH